MVSSEQRIALVLQTCLDAVQSGEDTFEGVLARYPELEEELRPQLEYALWLVSRRPMLEPDADFVRRSRARLMARIQAEQRSAARAAARASNDGSRRPPPPIPAPSSWLGNVLAVFRVSPGLIRVAVTLAVVLVLVLGADRLVENTQAAIPGEAGYSVKRTVEDLALAVSSDPGQHVVLNLEYSQRRLSETALLVEKARYLDANETLSEFEENVRGAVASLGEIHDRDTVHKELLAMTIQEKLDSNAEQLTSLLPRVPETVKPSVNRAITVSNSGMAIAATTIDRLMTMYTPTPEDFLLTPTPEGFIGTDPLATPTDASIFSIFSTPTEEFRQIFSSTASGPVTDPTSPPRDEPIFPTLPPPAATATPLPTDSDEFPTSVPTLVPRTRTPTPNGTPFTLTPPVSSTPDIVGGYHQTPTPPPSFVPTVTPN